MAPQIREDQKTHLKYHQTLVALSIDKKYVNIPSNVEVKLMTRGLGSSYIELKASPPYEKKGFLEDGSLLQGSTGMTSEFFPEESQKKLDELVNGIGTFINNANDVLGNKASRENIRITLSNLSDASKQVAQTLEELQKFLIASTNTSEELSKASAELRIIMEKVNNGQGTVARLVNDGRLYENLLENTEQMQVLLQEFKSFLAESRNKGVPIKLK
jgi:ABC-type transporter Mla subunit MlaD